MPPTAFNIYDCMQCNFIMNVSLTTSEDMYVYKRTHEKAYISGDRIPKYFISKYVDIMRTKTPSSDLFLFPPLR